MEQGTKWEITRSKQGERPYLAGRTPRISFVLGARPYQFGRPPLLIRADGLINQTTRPKPSFNQ